MTEPTPDTFRASDTLRGERIAKLIGLEGLLEQPPETIRVSVAAIITERIEALGRVTLTGTRSVKSWLDGTRRPELDALALMAATYETTVDWLLTGNGPEPTNALEPLDVDAVERLASGGRS